MPLLHPENDWQSPRIPCTMGTGHAWPGQGPVEVSPINRPPLHDPGVQYQFCDCCVPAAGTAHGHLFEVPTVGPPGQVHKTIILPLLHLHGMGVGNDLSYLNHIIIVHYNASYGCGKCLKQAFMSSSALHNHKKVCLRFTKKPTAGSDSKPSSGGGGNSSQGGGPTRATPKKKDSKAPTTDSQGSSAPATSQMTPHCSGHDRSHCSRPHKDSKSKKDLSGSKKERHVSPTKKGSGHTLHKHSSRC